jgi:DNA polymerase-3 subunit epsilon
MSSLDAARFVYFDLETTSLDVETCRIVSVSALCGGETFDALVNPLIDIPAESSRIHHITNETVKDAKPWSAVAVDFLNWVAQHAGMDPVFVAYNAYKYDLIVFAMENSRVPTVCDFPRFHSIHAIDPLPIARRILKRHEVGNSYRQASVYKFLFGDEYEGQHSSLADVGALRKISEHDKFKTVVAASAKRMRDDWISRNVFQDAD